MASTRRFVFLRWYITWSRLLAAVMAIAAVIMAFIGAGSTGTGFFGFLVALLWALFSVVGILVVADFLDCLLAIEENTRTSRRSGSPAD